MQRIINGVAQCVLGTCRCPRCTAGHSGQTVRSFGRRIINGRTFYPYPTSSTYWLSATFAVAATFDAGQKIRRREQWDLAIKEKQRQLSYSTASVAEEEVWTQPDTQYVDQGDAVEEAQALDQSLQGDSYTSAIQYTYRQHPSCGRTQFQSRYQQQPNEESMLRRSQQAATLSAETDRNPGTPDRVRSNTECNDNQTNAVLPREQSTDEQELKIRYVHGDHQLDAAWLERQQQRTPRMVEDLANPKHLALLVNPGATLLEQVMEHEALPTTIGGDVRQHCLAPESVYLKESFKMHQRGAWSPKKAETVRLAANALQLRIVEELYDTRSYFDVTSLSSGVLRWLETDRIDVLNSQNAIEDAWRYAQRCSSDLEGYRPDWAKLRHRMKVYGRYDGTHETRPVSMNQQLRENFLTTRRRLLALHESNNSDQAVLVAATMLARVYDILDASDFPPNLNTYNILIAGFSDCNMKTMAADAIRALRRSHLRPNESTVATILQHYTRYGVRKRFEYWNELFEGKHQGLALSSLEKIPDTHVKPILKFKERLHANEKPKLLQLQSPNPKVFSAIIAGVVHFQGISAALEKIKTLGLDDWGLTMDSLGPLLRDCATRKDLATGEQFWELVCRLERMAKRRHLLHNPNHKVEVIPQHVFAAMLDLCQRTEATERYSEIEKHAKASWPNNMADVLDINTPKWRAMETGFRIKRIKYDPVSVVRKFETESLRSAVERKNSSAIDRLHTPVAHPIAEHRDRHLTQDDVSETGLQRAASRSDQQTSSETHHMSGQVGKSGDLKTVKQHPRAAAASHVTHEFSITPRNRSPVELQAAVGGLSNDKAVPLIFHHAVSWSSIGHADTVLEQSG